MDQANQTDAVSEAQPPKIRKRLSLEERAAQLRAQAELLDNKAKTAALNKGKDLRNHQARQIGYWVLDQIKKGKPIPEIQTWDDLVAHLDPYLVPDAHRAYFKLPLLPDTDTRKMSG